MCACRAVSVYVCMYGYVCVYVCACVVSVYVCIYMKRVKWLHKPIYYSITDNRVCSCYTGVCRTDVYNELYNLIECAHAITECAELIYIHVI